MYRLLTAAALSSLATIYCSACHSPVVGHAAKTVSSRPVGPIWRPFEFKFAYFSFGGKLEFDPVMLIVPPGKYRSVILWRHYNNPHEPIPESYLDIYEIKETSNLDRRQYSDMQYRIYWDVIVPEEEPNAVGGVLCPKVSWINKRYKKDACYAMEKTDTRYKDLCPEVPWKENYYKKAACYSIAGVDWQSLKSCWEDEEGQWLYLPEINDNQGTERGGCKSISPKKLEPGTVVQFEFLADRPGNFRLLPLTAEEKGRTERDWRKPGATFVSVEGVCRVVPESNRWAVRIDERGWVYRRLMCRSDEDCEQGTRCAFLPGCEPGIGLCKWHQDDSRV